MDELGDYLRRWDLTLDGAPTRTNSSLVVPVRRGGEAAILKIVKPASDEERSPGALRYWAGEGAVRLLAWEGRASLVERALPGTPLSTLVEAGRDDEATTVLADVMVKLRRSGMPPGQWPTIEDWGDAFRRQRLRGPHPHLPQTLFDRGESAFHDLCRSQGKRIFLHGDLHHYNLLHDEARGWLAIDPKGVVAEACFETAMLLRNPKALVGIVADPNVMARRVAILADRLGLEPGRILAWCFAQSILCAAWSIEDGDPDIEVIRSVAVAETALSLSA